MPDSLTLEERKILLRIAREAIEKAVKGKPIPDLDLECLPERLRNPGATFVTLTKCGALRGCIGTLEAHQPLAIDVQEHAVTAALLDFRFSPLETDELIEIVIGISYLNSPQPLAYQEPEDLVQKIHPRIDGVILRDSQHKATFLPQVWEKICDPVEFLDFLCMKMGLPAGHWRQKELQVYTYQVDEFHE